MVDATIKPNKPFSFIGPNAWQLVFLTVVFVCAVAYQLHQNNKRTEAFVEQLTADDVSYAVLDHTGREYRHLRNMKTHDLAHRVLFTTQDGKQVWFSGTYVIIEE